MGSNFKKIFAESKLDASPSVVKSALPARWYDPAGARLTLLNSITIARQRRETLLRFNRLKTTHGAAKAAGLVGASLPTLWRWRKQFAAHGLSGLRPKQAHGGKRSPFAKLKLRAAAVCELERLVALTGSRAAAWWQFARTPNCPPAVARYVKRNGKAPAQFTAIGKVWPVTAQCYISADGRRIWVKIQRRAVFATLAALPPNFALDGSTYPHSPHSGLKLKMRPKRHCSALHKSGKASPN